MLVLQLMDLFVYNVNFHVQLVFKGDVQAVKILLLWFIPPVF